ncbi:MAG: phosphate signaling complex protein PhoU [Actinobacteria bacterium]|nr:phosphate signaling complex protein PhoU [Actinomycetota bacterium]
MVLRSLFQRKLEKLQKEIIEMGQITSQMIKNSMDALVERDEEKIARVLEYEDLVDDTYSKLEARCARLIATQAPVATDLRIITAAFKILSDVERIADYSVDIAFVAKEMINLPPLKPYKDFPRMAELDTEMLNLSLKAYAELDVESCYQVGEMDSEVDALYRRSFNEIIELMKKSPENVTRGAHLLLVGRYLERIGDHITNIAERIIYIATGEVKKLNR